MQFTNLNPHFINALQLFDNQPFEKKTGKFVASDKMGFASIPLALSACRIHRNGWKKEIVCAEQTDGGDSILFLFVKASTASCFFYFLCPH